MTRDVRPWLLVVALAASLGLVGCARDLDEAARAAAKCSNAVSRHLELQGGDTSLRTSNVAVNGAASQRTVTGRWSHPSKGEGDYECVVVPDDSDKLRGLRVTAIDVRTVQGSSTSQSPAG